MTHKIDRLIGDHMTVFLIGIWIGVGTGVSFGSLMVWAMARGFYPCLG